MTEIRKIEPEEAEGEVAVLYEAAEAMLGRVPNFYRFLAHSPLVAKMLLPFNAVLQRQGAGSVLTTKLKELVVIKTSDLNGCAYCYAHNTSLGMAAGITDEQIEAIGLDDYMDNPHLSPREKAAVLWAEHVTRNTAKSRDDVYENVSKHFSEAEMVELTLICGMFNMFNRFMESLRGPMDAQKEIDDIQRSLHLNPDRLRGYLETVIERWPSEFPTPAPEPPTGQ